MVSRQPVVLFGLAISPVVSRSVGDRPRPDGGGREAAVVMETSGESGGSLEGNQCVFLFDDCTVPILYIYKGSWRRGKKRKKNRKIGN